MKDLSNETMIHVRKQGIEYLQFRKLLEYPEIKHAFTLRPINFAGINDYEEKQEEVKQNYTLLGKALEINPKDIYRPKQTHTANVSVIKEQVPGTFTKELEDVDALVTNQPEKALALVFADCTPLLFYDPVKKVIANTHSGWKGTLHGIGRNTVKVMIDQFHCDPGNILCFIGPTIRKCHFEVDEDVKDLFVNQYKEELMIQEYITKKNDKYYIDTVGINKQILVNMGLQKENIIDSHLCTVCEEEQMHSYRAQKLEAGRAIAMIELEK